MNKRPFSILILSLLFVLVGLGGLLSGGWYFPWLSSNNSSSHVMIDPGLRMLSGAIALTSGVFMLRAANWAKWLCLIWFALHVLLSYFHSWSEMLAHALLLIIASCILFRPTAAKYFSPRTPKPQQG